MMSDLKLHAAADEFRGLLVIIYFFTAALMAGVLRLSFTALKPVILLPSYLFFCWYSITSIGNLYDYNGDVYSFCTSMMLNFFYSSPCPCAIFRPCHLLITTALR